MSDSAAPDRADIELAFLRMLTLGSHDEIDLSHFDAPGFLAGIDAHDVGTALGTLAGAARSQRPADRFAAAQGLVHGHRTRAEHGADGPLVDLATALAGGGDGEALLRGLDGLEPGMRLDSGALAPFIEAFGEMVQLEERAVGLALSGPLAPLVQMLVEMVTMPPRCRVRTGTYQGQQATLVESDACTNLPFDRCTSGVDPLRWPSCSPFFISVRPIEAPVQAPDGWSGTVREEVGPGLNGSVYVTNLAVTYLHRPKMAVTTFDLAPSQEGADGRVTVDHGFVSTTDEGAHRRIRALKVFRIDDLQVPLSWVCPLWCQQVSMAAWWCPS